LNSNKYAKVIIATICILVGLYSGFVIGFFSVLALFKLIEFLTRPLEAMWLLLMIIAFLAGLILGVILAVIFAKIALRRINMEGWKINGFALIVAIFLISLILHWTIHLIK